MRLLACDSSGNLSFTKDIVNDAEIPPYAILSHTWQEGHEVSFDEMRDGSDTARQKSGYKKIEFCAQQAQRADLHYVWVDTCCINKATDLTELQEALNSMFKWYQHAVECYVYLSDVSTSKDDPQSAWEPAFRRSRWFTRGWTLQELLAPHEVRFFSHEGIQLGDKRTLEQQITEITGIPLSALRGTPPSEFGVEERLSWIRGRETSREEDKAYSLLGIFNVFMLPNYGEKETYAFKRLREEIGKLESLWLVPFPKPLCFVGRKTQLAQLNAHFSAEGGQRLAIYGLGGCGKTALALQSVYLLKEHQPTRAIFWVSAISRDSFEQGYHEIAELLGVYTCAADEDNKSIKQWVKDKLSNATFGQWLLVVDNADSSRVLFGQPGEESDENQLINFLPSNRKGSIVFTTRTRETAIKLAGSNVIALGELNRTDAAEVLETRLLEEHRHQLLQQAVVDEFLSILFFHALAIVQAVAYVNMNDFTLSDYIAQYRRSEQDAVELLSEEFQDQGRYRDTRNSIATTWFLSFEEIQKQDSIAAEYLSFMACVANNDIPVSMLPEHHTKTEQVKAINTLKAYAFIAEQRNQKEAQDSAQKIEKMFNMHPLVHLSIRGWLVAHNQWDLWKERAVSRLLAIIPYKDEATTHCATYLPHAQHVVKLPEIRRTKGRLWLLEVVGTCERRIWFEYDNWACREAAELGDRILGKEYADVSSAGTRAKVMIFHGNIEGAKILLREAIATEKKTWGEMRTNTLLVCTAHLAWCLNITRWFKNAELLLREQLAGEKNTPGSVPPHVLVATMAHLGISLDGQNRVEEANKMLLDTLELEEKLFGKSQCVLESLGQVGWALRERAMYMDMEKHIRERLAERARTFGSDHAQTLLVTNHLRTILYRQSKYKEAEEVQKQLLVLYNKTLGPEHPEVLVQRGHLGNVLACQLRFAEAAQLQRDTIELMDRVLGERHPTTLAALVNMACYLDDQELYVDALPWYKRASEGYQATLGPDHQLTKIWSGIYEAVQEVFDSGVLKNKSPETAGTASASTVPQSQASSTTELALRPKEWWRPQSRKWKAGKDTLHRWFTEGDGVKEHKKKDLA
ncbi:HET-domain-containing protein [Ophiobolus disseminans]|uniref:HET-domain-containing protein n=1 Tax=Ophiobolus disseminans TaxID=1469910 RepID=A0A6A6ZSE9_9PLEO|nr:HET-domain-containing protein [Ophiobolus disseminans]